LPRREEVLSGRQTLRGIDLLVAWSLLGVEFGFIPSLDDPAGQDLMDAKLKAVGERVFECTQFEAWKRRSSLFGLSEFTVSVCVCNICIDVKPLLFLFSLLLVFIVIGFNGFVQGVPGIIASLALTKTLALICDIRKGHLSDVPAKRSTLG